MCVKHPQCAHALIDTIISRPGPFYSYRPWGFLGGGGMRFLQQHRHPDFGSGRGVTHTVRGLVDDSAKSTEPFRPFWPAKRLGHSVFVRFRRSPIIGRPPEYGSTVVMRYRTLAERRWRRRRYTRYFCRRGVANGFRAKQPKRFTVVFRLILSAIVFRNRPNGVRRRLTTGTIAYTRTCEFVWNKKLKKVKIISEIAFVSFVLCVEVPNTLERVKRALLCLFSQRASTIFKWIIPVP